jgi:predicted RNA-binding Zn-ribbon protein involved in translation (DUF1610 family)
MEKKQETPKLLRFLVILFSALFFVLAMWLLGFVVDDIGTIAGPSYESVELRHLDPDRVAKRKGLEADLAEVIKLQTDQKERQTLLRDSTNSSKETMNQLLEMQRLGLEKGLKPSAEEQKSLAESERLFLSNQRQYQTINEEITLLSERQRQLEGKIKTTDEALDAQRVEARGEFDGLLRKHNYKIAFLKLLFLIPLLFLSVVAFIKWRHSLYAPFVYTAGAAILLRVVMVMHQHFPAKYFKYLLLLAAMGIVVRILVYIIKLAAAPRGEEWLSRQHREAYEKFVCPSCSFPVRAGALRQRMPGGLGGFQGAKEAAEEELPYTCPSCGAAVYERCASCGGLRHAKLPFCEKCGSAREKAQ